MDSFFDFRPGGGTGLFSPLHILWLMNSLLLCLWSGGMARRGRRSDRAAALALLVCEAVRVLALFFCGVLDRGYLPLHLCSLAVYACVLHGARGGALTGELIYSTLAPGAVTALLFPDWLDHRPDSFLFLSSFGIHMLICAYAAAMLARGFCPDRRRLKGCAGFLLLYGGLVFLADLALDTNYLFLLAPAPDSPLEWAARVLPWHGLLYLPAVAAVWGLLYAPPVLRLLHKNSRGVLPRL
jgi:uncharacterized membrane protein YwaF